MKKTDGIPKTSDKVVNSQKYLKYDDSYLEFGFTSIDVSHQEHLQCVLCVKVLAPECLLPAKLKRHLETDHPNMATKSCDYFTRKLRELKEQKGTLFKQASVPNNALLASYKVPYRVAKYKETHTIVDELILPIAVIVVNIMVDESAGRLPSEVPLSDSTVSCRIQHMAKDLKII